MTGQALTIEYDLPFAVRAGFAGISVSLDESAGWYNAATRQRASGTEVKSVLSALNRIEIRANPSSGSGTLVLDNVTFGNMPTTPPSSSVETGFTGGNEGWLVHRAQTSLTAPIVPAWDPNGFLLFADDGGTGTLRWIAPAAILGDRSAVYGGTLSFETTGVIDAGNTRVAISGGGHMLYYPAQTTQRGEPVTISIRFSESDQWYDLTTGQRASRQQLQDVLEDLTSLVILGKVETLYHTPSDFRLDNVLLRP